MSLVINVFIITTIQLSHLDVKPTFFFFTLNRSRVCLHTTLSNSDNGLKVYILYCYTVYLQSFLLRFFFNLPGCNLRPSATTPAAKNSLGIFLREVLIFTFYNGVKLINKNYYPIDGVIAFMLLEGIEGRVDGSTIVKLIKEERKNVIIIFNTKTCSCGTIAYYN
ncbi:hypothetical protein RCL_jg4969.t1 [Rhizophagus clarus]|uniref:Uncharacterized protein n=1 Tax=Rhizophagus clarus TaxID=94130 RepID=A0A8H3L5U3_9GLOM|nr:hypothetical protein RCL_jg4969.t1 [Rhizophagus clarus]